MLVTDHLASSSSSQWLFPVSALSVTPSITTSGYTLDKELYDRARGVEFLFRLGSSLGLPSTAMFTAATWFHRFFMRYSLEDYHRQDVAASCIFLATKTEECGRKLRDVARVCEAKIANTEVPNIAADGKEVELRQTSILLTEEVLLEALCFDFVVDCPHTDLVDIFASRSDNQIVQEYAWSIAHDSYRTPLCLLFPPKIIAGACYIYAQCVADGPQSASLDERISTPTTSEQLASRDGSREAIEYYKFSESDLAHVADALTTLVEFYTVQDQETMHPHIIALQSVSPPTLRASGTKLYHSRGAAKQASRAPQTSHSEIEQAKVDGQVSPSPRLDLS